MDLLEKARRVINLEVEELQGLSQRLDSSFESAISLLKQCVVTGGKLVFIGVGKSGNIGSKLAATFNSTGAPSTVMNCQDALHGDLGLVNDGDCLIAMSYSGETAELLRLLPHLKRKRIQIIAITGKPESTLGESADCVLNVEVTREACPLNLAPTSSSTNTLVMGDALAMVLLESRGFTKENFAELHPGGSLGRALLMRASDIMRQQPHIAVVAESADVSTAIAEMSRARAGAVIVTNQDDTLAGVFTQGDFTRAFQSGQPQLGEAKVRDFMTKDPVTTSEASLVGEVLKQLEQYRIDDLIVIDHHGKPVGMIDTQDLTRLRVV